MRKCVSCNKKYEKVRADQKYCSEKFRKKVLDRNYRDKYLKTTETKIYYKICTICSGEFVARQKVHKYCSKECRIKVKRSMRTYTSLGDCENCGFNDSRAVHRHHLNPLLGNAGGLMILCANCHTVYHKIFNNREKIDTTKENVKTTLRREHIRA